MFKEMRRSDRQLQKEDIEEILAKGEYGILSTISKDGYPYGVPLSYAYYEGIIYFHGAKGVGHKLENIDFNNKACFTVVGDTCVLPSKFATKYESVIAFGTVVEATDKLNALEKIREKYSPDFEEQGKKYAKGSEPRVGVYEFHIEHVTGKARR